MKTAIWYDADMFKATLIGGVVGLVVGVAIGYEWAWQPVVTVFRPLVG